MSSKLALNLTKYYSINFDLKKRKRDRIKFIIIHYTGMKKEKDAIDRLCDYKSKVSCHYFIKRNGNILNLVPDLYKSWHAGKSYWKKFNSLNKYSIGIELSNPGHEHGYKKFSSKQISSLIKLLKYLTKKYRIKRQNVLGHSDIAPNRKKDPGEKFPWDKLSKKNLCSWHNLDLEKLGKLRNIKVDGNKEIKFLRNLNKIGYSIAKGNKLNLIIAFQRRFRQALVNGKIDFECLEISKNLINTNK